MDDFEILKTYVNTLTNQLFNLNSIVQNMTTQTAYLTNIYNDKSVTYDIAKLETKSSMGFFNIQTESIIGQKNIIQGLIDDISKLVN